MLGAVPSPANADRGADSPNRLGVMADAGAPDGFMAGLMFRVSPRWRLNGGAGYNTMSLGVRAGIRTDLLTGPVSPYAAVELGYYGAGEAQAWMRSIASDAGLDAAQLHSVRYRFANFHLGLRFGGDRAALFVQGGVSRVDSTLEVVQLRAADGPDAPGVEIHAASTLSGWIPSGRFGLAASF